MNLALSTARRISLPALIVALAASILGSPATAQLQLPQANDRRIGPQDITVLVYMDDDDNSTPLTPVIGATVTLQGVYPTSWNGIVQPTGAGGAAIFPGVAGPYSMTAQADHTWLGTTTRLASSLIDVQPAISGNPPAGTIGVPLFASYEVPPSVDAWLSGNVANLPALSGNQFVEVVAVANGPVDFEWSTTVDPSTGFYSMPIPSNTPIDCFVAHREDPAFDKRTILATLIQPGVGQIGPGATLSWNPDFGSTAVVPWNATVGFSATNVHPAMDLSIQLVVEDAANGIRFDFSFFDGYPAPTSFTLPDVTDPKLAGYRIELDADTFDPLGNIEAGQEHEEVLTTTPASVAFDFPSLPTILHPAHLSILTMAQFDALEVRILEGSTGTFGSNGFNHFTVATEAGASGPPPPGID